MLIICLESRVYYTLLIIEVMDDSNVTDKKEFPIQSLLYFALMLYFDVSFQTKTTLGKEGLIT